jgi:hypothetical protein
MMPSNRQCGTCAYRGRFADAPAFVQQSHIDFMEDGETEGPHGCHERKEQPCVGCARWIQEAIAASAPPA